MRREMVPDGPEKLVQTMLVTKQAGIQGKPKNKNREGGGRGQWANRPPTGQRKGKNKPGITLERAVDFGGGGWGPSKDQTGGEREKKDVL